MCADSNYLLHFIVKVAVYPTQPLRPKYVNKTIFRFLKLPGFNRWQSRLSSFLNRRSSSKVNVYGSAADADEAFKVTVRHKARSKRRGQLETEHLLG
jgi:hypothetical protein